MAWNSEYWDTMLEYFWSPSWLGCMRIRELCPDCRRRKPPKERFSEAVILKGLRRREETLNHIVNISLRLFPDQITSRLFSIPLTNGKSDSFQLVGAEAQDRYAFQGNITQQDVFLVGTDNLLCIELKLGHKSDLTQIAKYALLCALEEKLTGPRKALWLIYLTPKKPFSNLWKEGFQDEQRLREALCHFVPATFVKKSLSSIFSENEEIVRGALNRLQIGFMTYAQLADALEVEKAMLNELHPGDQTLGRLIDGLLAELWDRGLVETPNR